jgi:hypothetical protein
MPTKLRIGHTEARCQATDLGEHNAPPQARPQAQQVLPLCQ